MAQTTGHLRPTPQRHGVEVLFVQEPLHGQVAAAAGRQIVRRDILIQRQAQFRRSLHVGLDLRGVARFDQFKKLLQADMLQNHAKLAKELGRVGRHVAKARHVLAYQSHLGPPQPGRGATHADRSVQLPVCRPVVGMTVGQLERPVELAENRPEGVRPHQRTRTHLSAVGPFRRGPKNYRTSKPLSQDRGQPAVSHCRLQDHYRVAGGVLNFLHRRSEGAVVDNPRLGTKSVQLHRIDRRPGRLFHLTGPVDVEAGALAANHQKADSWAGMLGGRIGEIHYSSLSKDDKVDGLHTSIGHLTTVRQNIIDRPGKQPSTDASLALLEVVPLVRTRLSIVTRSVSKGTGCHRERPLLTLRVTCVSCPTRFVAQTPKLAIQVSMPAGHCIRLR